MKSSEIQGRRKQPKTSTSEAALAGQAAANTALQYGLTPTEVATSAAMVAAEAAATLGATPAEQAAAAAAAADAVGQQNGLTWEEHRGESGPEMKASDRWSIGTWTCLTCLTCFVFSV